MSDSDSDVAPAPPPKIQSNGPGDDVTQLKTRIVELEQQVSDLTTQLTTFREENDQYKSQIEQLNAELEALRKEKAQLQDELSSKTTELEKELEDAKAAITIAKAETEEAKANAKAEIEEAKKSSTDITPATVLHSTTLVSLGPNQEDSPEVLMLKLQLEEARQQIVRQEHLLLQTAAPTISIASAGTLQRRKPGEVTLKMRKNREEKLLAVRAQITAWLNKILSPEPLLVNETLMERLATGIIPCNLAIIVDDSAIAILGRVHLKASAYSILAHENVASFLRVCYDWGLKKVQCFSPEDLLSSNIKNRNERLVVETLLSLSRVVYLKFGIEPPWIVKAEMAIDESETNNQSNASMMNDTEHEKLLEAVRAYCALHGIADVPEATERQGQFAFSDGTRSHIRMFEIDPENADGGDREHATILEAVQNGELVLLVRHNNNWEELHKFLHEHSGGRKIDTNQIQLSAATAQTADMQSGSSIDETTAQPQVVEAPVVEVVDVMLDSYDAKYEEEDEDDDEDEEYLEECRRIAALEAQRAESARLAAQQAEAELALRRAALQAQQEEEEEFQRKKQKGKLNNSYVTDADLTGDMGEMLSKVRTGMGKGDFDTEKMNPDTASFSAIINTSDYKRFKDITMNEIQVMTNDDLERLAEYTAKQEFFYLTALAVKMTHELSYSSAFQVVTNQELWRRAIEQNVPFHRFYSFITNEITKSYLEQSALDKQSGAKDGVNLRSHRELMISNIKERQKQKFGSSRE